MDVSAGQFRLRPVTLAEANAFLRIHHRHCRRLPVARFSVGLECNGELVGVAVCGLPVARLLCDGWTLEVRRVCTTGVRNACSMLYAACRRAAQALGYRRLVTYTLPDESGASLRAVGFRMDGMTRVGSWNRPNRRRKDMGPKGPKLRWVMEL